MPARLLDSLRVVEGRERFEDLYLAHAGAVRTFVHRRSSATEADDVVAEVFLAAWRRRDEIPPDPLPWLLGIARGLLSNSRRRDARSSALVARLTSQQAASADRSGSELDAATVRALGSLSNTDQELLLLVAWEALSREEIATVLGLSPGAVAVRLHRARRRLQRALTREQARDSPVTGRSPEMEVS